MALPFPLGTAAEAYLEKLENDTRYIRVPGVSGRSDPHFPPDFPIDEIYLPLASAPTRRELLEGNAPSRIPLEHALTRRRVLLTGGPGSGKTTFLRRVAFELCRRLRGTSPAGAAAFLPADDERYPVLIPLRQFGAFLAEATGDIDPHSPDWIPRYLERQDLPEVVSRELLAGGNCLLLLDGLDAMPGETERVAGVLENAANEYGNSDFLISARAKPKFPALKDFAVLRILSPDAAAIEAWETRWNAPIAQALGKLPEFRVLGATPFVLTALAAVVHNDPNLANRRMGLYRALLDWHAAACHGDAESTLEHLGRLALHMQDPPTGKRLAQIERREAAEQFPGLDQELESGGILVASGAEVRFACGGYQDYLAAMELARLPEAVFGERVIETGKVYERDWRETIRVFTTVLHEGNERRLDRFIETILRAASHGDLLRAIAGASLVKTLVPHLSGLGYKLKSGIGELRERLLTTFDRAAESIDLSTRAAAGIAVGQIGDPRLDRDNWVVIPTSTFLRGAQKTDPEAPNYDPQALEQECPVHRVTLDPYRIQRFAVTVEQFQTFIEQGGYRNPEYWPKDYVPSFTEPENWQRQQQYPNLPVVGVSWYEAAAYCAWAGGRLPTEAEWERAARGPRGTRYPWGDEPAIDSTFANYNGGFQQPTPVGLYPKGNTPEGLSDMLGNVFEWCQDWFGPYRAENPPNPQGPSRGEMKVVRGGSWTFFPRSGRVSHRDRFLPSERHNFIGFRCAGREQGTSAGT